MQAVQEQLHFDIDTPSDDELRNKFIEEYAARLVLNSPQQTPNKRKKCKPGFRSRSFA